MTRRRARRWLAAFAIAAAAGCGGPADAPQDVVALYFRSLGRDPIRSADLVTPAFHARHGLRIRSTWSPASPVERPTSESGAELAWLGIQREPGYRAWAERLEWRLTDVRREGPDRVVVSVSIGAPGVPPFAQRLFLVRAQAGAPWRIDRIEQDAGVPANQIARFVANPMAAGGSDRPSPQP